MTADVCPECKGNTRKNRNVSRWVYGQCRNFWHDEPAPSGQQCGAPAEGGPCVLPEGHNMGRLDIPTNHKAAAPVSATPRTPNNDEVICPACTHQFRAIPLNVQRELAEAKKPQEVVFVDDWGVTNTYTIEQAANALRIFENEWPGGIEEIESALTGWRGRAESAEARAAELQKQLAAETARAHNAAIDAAKIGIINSVTGDMACTKDFIEGITYAANAVLALKVPQ